MGGSELRHAQGPGLLRARRASSTPLPCTQYRATKGLPPRSHHRRPRASRARLLSSVYTRTVSGERTLAHAVVALPGRRVSAASRRRVALSIIREGGTTLLAVGIRIKLPGVTKEQFDAAHDHINQDRSSP